MKAGLATDAVKEAGVSRRELCKSCFEVTNVSRNNNTLSQVITAMPYDWEYYQSYKPTNPVTEIGNPEWENYKATVDVMFKDKGFAEFHVRLTDIAKFYKELCLTPLCKREL